MFEGFETRRIALGEVTLHTRLGGEGPPLLLLHGYPQTHAAWHRVAPSLAQHFSLVIPDLPGYGESLGPPADMEHRNHSKRVTAEIMVSMMAQLGHDSFFLAGHDRGARVAYRLTLDHPERVRRLASLDTIPTLDVWEAMDWQAAIGTFHWPFLAQPDSLPERLIGAAPDVYLDYLLEHWAGSPDALDPAAVAQYRMHFRKPSVQTAMAEDYRAGASIDVEHDREDRATGKRIACPVFVPWGQRYTGGSLLPVWQRWADDVQGLEIDCGHFIAEEAPEICSQALIEFFER